MRFENIEKFPPGLSQNKRLVQNIVFRVDTAKTQKKKVFGVNESINSSQILRQEESGFFITQNTKSFIPKPSFVSSMPKLNKLNPLPTLDTIQSQGPLSQREMISQKSQKYILFDKEGNKIYRGKHAELDLICENNGKFEVPKQFET